MQCENCGADVPGGAKFCPSCGTTTGTPRAPGAEVTSSAPPGTPPGPAAGEVPPPPVSPPAGAGAYSQQPTPPGPVQPPGGPYPPHPGAPPLPQGPYSYVRNNPLCVAALVLGIASLVFLWGPFFGLGVAAGGIICAVLGMGQVDQSPQLYKGKNLAQVGLVLSIIGGALSIIWHVFWWSRMWWWH